MLSIINKTKDLTSQEILEDSGHLLLGVRFEAIDCILLEQEKISAFSKGELLASMPYNKDLTGLSGRVSWYNKASGEGMIVLTGSKRRIKFYGCNVEGADSHYHQLVTNVDLVEGSPVKVDLPADPHMFRALGALKVSKNNDL